jgi:hypothetical protein
MDPISNNGSYVGAVQVTAKQTNVQNLNDINQENIYSLSKEISNELKSRIVTEKPVERQDFDSYNLRFQQNVPASNLLSALPSYNEINQTTNSKRTSSRDSKNKNKNNFNFTHAEQNFNSVIGYYVVDSFNSSKESQSAQKSKTSPIKQQLYKAYHINNVFETGSLVNIVSY